MKKHLITYLICALLFVCLIPSAAEASSLTPTETPGGQPESTPEPDEPSVPESYTGWDGEGAARRYYENGKFLTGKRTVGGISYFFGKEDGYLQLDAWCQGQKWKYRTDSKGRIIMDKRIVVDGKIYYMDKNSHIYTKGWKTLKKGKSWFQSDGTAAVGLKTIQKKTYLFNADGYLVKNNWGTAGGKKYRTDKNGVILKNKQIKVGGKVYLLNSNGAVVTGWKSTSSGTVYFSSSGARVSGLQKIGGKQYYFDSSGVQRTSWRKIGGNYYFFCNAQKQSGYMVTSKKVNSVSLGKDGKAVKTSDSLEKLKLMTTASSTVDKITTSSDSKTAKLRKCFKYVITFPYQTRRAFRATKNWDRAYAGDILLYHRGNCFSYAASFAYLANALGYEASTVSSGGHGWAEIGGLVYDPDWSIASKVDSYFGMSYSLSGVNGRPLYKSNRLYVIKV